jgi:hypothetical protein
MTTWHPSEIAKVRDVMFRAALTQDGARHLELMRAKGMVGAALLVDLIRSYTMRTDDALRIRFFAMVGEEPEVEGRRPVPLAGSTPWHPFETAKIPEIRFRALLPRTAPSG